MFTSTLEGLLHPRHNQSGVVFACVADSTHPVEYWKHHVQLLLLLLLGHVARRVAQLGEEAAQMH